MDGLIQHSEPINKLPPPEPLHSSSDRDPLCLGIGGHDVYPREESSEAPVKRTHIHTNRAYPQPEYACKI